MPKQIAKILKSALKFLLEDRSSIISLYFKRYAHLSVQPDARHIQLGDLRLDLAGQIDFGYPIGEVSVATLADAAAFYERLTRGSCRPQLAALLFRITEQPYAMKHYFPLTRVLEIDELERFYKLTETLLRQITLDINLIDEHRVDITPQLPMEVAYLVVGHLAEIFFYREDILLSFLSRPRYIRLYTTRQAFADDGGVAGGDYNPDTESMQLVLSRLFEGFYDVTPGVAPFLHEFGHMLEAFDASQGTMGHGTGLLPGLRSEDGAIYTPSAREAFLQGKQLELDRYLKRCNGISQADDELPIGHPYVFQNDTEFVAGYFEMFFRNPHYFAAMNPALFQGFVTLFGQDTRRAWREDFPFYIQQNRDFYLNSGQRPHPPGLTIQ